MQALIAVLKKVRYARFGLCPVWRVVREYESSIRYM